MGTAPAPDLANDFAFTHEFMFLRAMMDKYMQAMNDGNEPLYPCTFIEQYGVSTKWCIDDILSVALGSQPDSPTFEQIIKQEGNIYGGMYPTTVEDVDGLVMETPIYLSPNNNQGKQYTFFIHMEIFQSPPGVSQIRMYGKRDHMPTLA